MARIGNGIVDRGNCGFYEGGECEWFGICWDGKLREEAGGHMGCLVEEEDVPGVLGGLHLAWQHSA